jgi:Zn-finger nucleic acid-binding protein
MHRLNFAKCSGVVIDTCRPHGGWFDRDELQHIVEFIRGGGLSVAREKEKAELESARRRLEAARNAPLRERTDVSTSSFGEADLFDIAGSVIFYLTGPD